MPANTPIPASRAAPGVIAPTNRINVALPFSKIVTQEPSRALSELSTVVAELAGLVRRLAPGADAELICERAQALAAGLS